MMRIFEVRSQNIYQERDFKNYYNYMKYVYVLLMSFVLLYGCTTKKDDDKSSQEVMKGTDSLKNVQKNLDKILDSLNRESKNQDEKLRQMEIELDSLKKRAKQ